MGRVMGSITYYVAMGFERSEEEDLVAMEAMESQSSTQAVRRHQASSASSDGEPAMSRTSIARTLRACCRLIRLRTRRLRHMCVSVLTVLVMVSRVVESAMKLFGS